MSHRGPVSHRPWRSRVDPKKRGVKRSERSSGSGAQGPRRSSRHGFMLGRAETRPLRAQRRTTSILIPVTRTKMRLSSAVFGIGNERRARRHLSLARDPAISAASYAPSPTRNRDYTLVKIITRDRIPSQLSPITSYYLTSYPYRSIIFISFLKIKKKKNSDLKNY